MHDPVKYGSLRGVDMPTGSRFRFGDFMLELGTRELTERETVRHLSPKAFDLLSLLVESCPKVISKKTLIEYLWPDTFVAEVNLASLVAELRRTLHDDAARPSFIRTVHRHGYAFCGKVQQDISSIAGDIEKAANHWVVWETGQVRLAKGNNVLGRGRRATVWLDSPTISRRHARIVVSDLEAALEDLGSRNGTYVRGERVATPVPLKDGDEIRLGSVLLVYRLNSGQRTTIVVEE